jgi:hypothetical protein
VSNVPVALVLTLVVVDVAVPTVVDASVTAVSSSRVVIVVVVTGATVLVVEKIVD